MLVKYRYFDATRSHCHRYFQTTTRRCTADVSQRQRFKRKENHIAPILLIDYNNLSLNLLICLAPDYPASPNQTIFPIHSFANTIPSPIIQPPNSKAIQFLLLPLDSTHCPIFELRITQTRHTNQTHNLRIARAFAIMLFYPPDLSSATKSDIRNPHD